MKYRILACIDYDTTLYMYNLITGYGAPPMREYVAGRLLVFHRTIETLHHNKNSFSHIRRVLFYYQNNRVSRSEISPHILHTPCTEDWTITLLWSRITLQFDPYTWRFIRKETTQVYMYILTLLKPMLNKGTKTKPIVFFYE